MGGYFQAERDLLGSMGKDDTLTAADFRVMMIAMRYSKLPGDSVALGIDYLVGGTDLDRSTVIRSRRHLVQLGYLVPGGFGLRGLAQFSVATGGVDATPQTALTGGVDATPGGVHATCRTDATGGVGATGTSGMDATGTGGVGATQIETGNIETYLGDAPLSPEGGEPVFSPPLPEKKSSGKSRTQFAREQAAERIDTLYRTNVPNEHNRKFGPAASQKRIVAILKTSKRTEEDLTRSVMNYAKVAGDYPVGVRRFFSKQQGDMWEQYIEADVDVVKRGKSSDLSDLNYKLDGVLAQHGDSVARLYDSKARELGSTTAADAWLESNLQEALCQVN